MLMAEARRVSPGSPDRPMDRGIENLTTLAGFDFDPSRAVLTVRRTILLGEVVYSAG